jgi:hypothetical protein
MKREVQFLIERECPEPGDVPTNLRAYPDAVFVEWPGITKGGPGFCGSQLFFRLKPADAQRLGHDDPGDWYVCQHMGRLIE